jgi:hypothetical protein
VDTTGVNSFFYHPDRIQDITVLANLPTHTWRMFPNHAGLSIDAFHHLMEFDHHLLFENQ